MKKILLVLLLSLVHVHAFSTKDERAIRELAIRIVPSIANKINFKQVESNSNNDFFEIESKNNIINIRGNSANSMAVGLNHYLKHYCKTTVSWYLSDPIELPNSLPPVNDKVSIDAKVDKRFFLNYCTFGYTMPWWQWEDWERLIDWMALNGINMPLAITGQEYIWLKVWKKFGLTDQEIKNYFTGPAYLPWHRMANIDYWLGNLPDSWLNHQADLQKKIVKRERELNMTPVLPAFAGHVPIEIKRIYPEAKINKLSMWGGFSEPYHSQFLDPLDPLFAEIQKEFMKEQKKMYGTDHIYGADPFNEMIPPSWEPEYLATVSRTIYETMKQEDPKASWLQMTWLFYFDQKHWTNERIDAFVNAVPKNKMILLDYFAEDTEVWKRTESYFGQPYIWCYLGNFGGNTMLVGNMKDVGERIENTFINGGDNLWGIGSTLEEFGVNPMMFEYVFDKAWSFNQTDKEWMNAWSDRRVGNTNTELREVWQDIYKNIYIANSQLGQGALTNTRPCLEGYGTWTTRPHYKYSNIELFSLWERMLNTAKNNNTAYTYDIINIGRQVLSNYFGVIRDEFTQAYKNKDKDLLQRKGMEMLELLDDLDLLLSGHSSFLFGKWVADASKFGLNEKEVAYYKKNAICLLTTWGEKGASLNDYANRSWAGLTKDYYKPRWQQFIADVQKAVTDNREFDQTAFNEKIVDWEEDFTNRDYSAATIARTDGVELAKRLKDKYKSNIIK